MVFYIFYEDILCVIVVFFEIVIVWVKVIVWRLFVG